MKMFAKAIAVCLLASSGVAVIAQTDAHSKHHPATQTKSSSSKSAKPMQMDMCKEMMAEKKAMGLHMKEMDSKMESMVSKMDAANGEDKLAATSAAVKEMVAQRIMMNKMMEAMEAKMMEHMMMHMKSGKTECPMMKGMKGMSLKTSGQS
jgi:hypothetical protein